ncbi:hypothetical protein SUDANB121_00848 [Nocardiopsis dassonvillei]|uniref:hypothetical protein n=1 Tax=Nocardiopsis dassonvillei TaxID=2014 RepID=UPI003F57A243
MCTGNHDIAKIAVIGFHELNKIVQEFDGHLPIDLDAVSQDLYAMVLANELRFFVVQAHTSVIEAMWALGIMKSRYVLLAPETVPSPSVLRAAQWRAVMLRRHLAPALGEEVLACAGLASREDIASRWKVAVPLTISDRRPGVVVHMPYKETPGVVRTPASESVRQVELDLLLRDAKSYAHCRSDHAHPTVGRAGAESGCGHLRRGDQITYTPMRRPSGKRVAFLVRRLMASDDPRPHPSGIGFTPLQ